MTKVPPELGHPFFDRDWTSAGRDGGRTRAKIQRPGILGGRRFISVSITTTEPSGSIPEGLAGRGVVRTQLRTHVPSQCFGENMVVTPETQRGRLLFEEGSRPSVREQQRQRPWPRANHSYGVDMLVFDLRSVVNERIDVELMPAIEQIGDPRSWCATLPVVLEIPSLTPAAQALLQVLDRAEIQVD
jgi:hypothetical protein